MHQPKTNKKLIIGNWKMNPQSIAEAKKTFVQFKSEKHNTKNITTVICPPFVYLNELKRMYMGSKIFFGAQDVFWKSEGSFTGEISVGMVTNLGARFVILGHSERRALGENNQMVSQKAKIALKEDLHTVICVGEPDRDDHGRYISFIEEQIHESLKGISKNSVKKLVIAYEPIWAIGKGKHPMNPHELHQMSLFIRKTLINIYGKKIGVEIPILYGGSVDSKNACELVYEGEVQGLLVGRASLNPHEFSKIINAVASKK